MENSVHEYLNQLDLTPTVRARADETCLAFEKLCRASLERVFVSDAIDEASRERSFDSIWGFSGEFWMEARDFTRQFDLDVSAYTRAVLYIGVRYEAMTLGEPASDASRMRLEIETAKVRYSLLYATGQNCDALAAILNDLLLPNLKTTGDAEGRESRVLG